MYSKVYHVLINLQVRHVSS